MTSEEFDPEQATPISAAIVRAIAEAKVLVDAECRGSELHVALIEQDRDAADELLQRDPAAAQAHLERWLGGRAEFVKA